MIETLKLLPNSETLVFSLVRNIAGFAFLGRSGTVPVA